jgi:hypothetical protein
MTPSIPTRGCRTCAAWLLPLVPVLLAMQLPQRLGAAEVSVTSASGDGGAATSQSTSHDAPSTGSADAPAAGASSRWDLEILNGVRFGGIIGASIDNTLTYETRRAVEPELDADVGVGGTTCALGARWTLERRHWVMTSNGRSLDFDYNTAIVPKAIASYRWEDRKRSPSLWRGMPADGGWYYGGEVDVLVHAIALATQVTWEQEHHQHAPRFTLAYGFGF